jgi:hypothetical protein
MCAAMSWGSDIAPPLVDVVRALEHRIARLEADKMPPVEQWQDVTAECQLDWASRFMHDNHYVVWGNGYRLRKVDGTFIVEKRL